MNSFHTHQPTLIKYAHYAWQNILECGVGLGSTQILLDIVKQHKGKLTSCESDINYLNKYKHLQCDRFNLVYTPSWQQAIKDNPVFQNNYSLIFVDCHDWAARLCIINAMIDKADFMILHDSQHLKPEQRNFKYVKEFGLPASAESPSTLVMSNFYSCEI